MPDAPHRRVALVVHPTRPVDNAMAAVQRWTDAHGLELVQLVTGDTQRELASPGDVDAHDLVVALGGDGTVLAALREAAKTDTPVLGVACGSLGALSAVPGGEVVDALDRFHGGDWTARSLPGLAVETEAGNEWAVNDFVVVRRSTGQVAADVMVDGELYVRLAGDGLIVATPLGSSAYSMAAGGPILTTGTHAFLCTPLAMHGGSAPPVVVPGDGVIEVEVFPGYAGFDVEIDGHRRMPGAHHFRFTLHPDKLRLVTFADAGRGLTGLRQRGLILDSPRIVAREKRAK